MYSGHFLGRRLEKWLVGYSEGGESLHHAREVSPGLYILADAEVAGTFFDEWILFSW